MSVISSLGKSNDLGSTLYYMKVALIRSRTEGLAVTCERAVAFEPDHGGILDSRGLARALTGDLKGARKDFDNAVAWAEETGHDAAFIESRTAWIAALKAGKNAFDEATLEQLRNE